MDENNGLSSSDVVTILDKAKTIVELTIGIGTILSVVFGFFTYVVQSLYFNYWEIDIFYYNEDNLIYNLIYFFCGSCFLVFTFIFLEKNINSDKNKIKNIVIGFLFYLITFYLLNMNSLFKQGLNVSNFILHFISSFILFFLLLFFAKSKCVSSIMKNIVNYISRLSKEKISDNIYNIFLDVICFVISFFLSIIIIGMCELWVKKDYQIIETNQPNECSVVLYSTKDYFVVSECKMDEEKNKLTIYKGKVKKIDNVGIIANKRIFSAIEKK